MGLDTTDTHGNGGETWELGKGCERAWQEHEELWSCPKSQTRAAELLGLPQGASSLFSVPPQHPQLCPCTSAAPDLPRLPHSPAASWGFRCLPLPPSDSPTTSSCAWLNPLCLAPRPDADRETFPALLLPPLAVYIQQDALCQGQGPGKDRVGAGMRDLAQTVPGKPEWPCTAPGLA